MAQPTETFLACVRPKFFAHSVNLDKLLTAHNRYYKSRTWCTYVIANALFRGEFQKNWNNDHTAQMLINTGKCKMIRISSNRRLSSNKIAIKSETTTKLYFAGMVKHFIENGGGGELPKLNKYKKYGVLHSHSVRICMASIIAIAHSPFYTGEYYSTLSPLWQRIAHKVRPTYKVVLRSAVDELIGPPGILWRPIILPNVYKNLINSESDVFDDISIMPWHSFPNVQINRRPLIITKEMPALAAIAKNFRNAAVQTDEFSAVVTTTTKEIQTDAEPKTETDVNRVKIRKTRKADIRNRDLMTVFNKLMEREMHRYDENNSGISKWMSEEMLTTNQWFPVVSIKRSRSIENLVANSLTDEPAPKRKQRKLQCTTT